MRPLDWDICPDSFSDSRLVWLARAACGMHIPLQSTPGRHLPGDQILGAEASVREAMLMRLPAKRREQILRHDRTGDSSGASVELGHLSRQFQR